MKNLKSFFEIFCDLKYIGERGIRTLGIILHFILVFSKHVP
ncbi:hypothetical protein P689_119126 [Candidatus Riesia pediculischaeffi PTSU]|uniref:Uncharacterized protein n=1 Tax=Candidatus Riesia pediculischaeffi PTSU TaxID=1401651 RepID=A0A0C1VJW5_9ENTR|nr:hypothetical protein P689_119126 [Candidatus Riesia pediculischaeffi PTSU]